MLSVICSLTIASMLASAQEAAPAAAVRPNIEAFVKTCENSRKGAIMQLEHTLRGLRASGAKSPDVIRQIAAAEADLRVLRAGKEPLVPSLGFPPEVGAIGRLPRLTCHVEQVLSSSEMIVRCNFPVKVTTVRHYQARGETVTQGITFLVRGMSTREAHEGTDLQILQVLEITGKQTYKTVEGKLNTVWVLAEFDMKTAEPYFRQLAAGRK
jgi:hypothetical protein